jgi:hypothetical protein
MAKENNKDSFQQNFFDVIKNQTGKNNMLTIPTEILNYTGDLPSAAFLSQLIYWCDKGKSPDGYIFKSAKEWKRETGLSEHLIKKASRKFQKMGILHTKKKKANASPTIHYKLDRKAFINSFLEFLRNETENIGNGNLKTSDSLTELTSEPSSEPTKRYKGVNSEEVHTRAISFKEYCERFHLEDTEEVEAIQYFLQAYRYHRGVEHTILKPDQWQRVVDTIFSCNNAIGDSKDLTLDDITIMTDKYFETKFQEGCNYAILHFNNDGVKTNRMYEVAY